MSPRWRSRERVRAKQIERRAAGQPTDEAFRYHDKGSMATVSRFSAVASVGQLRFGGFVAWVLWLAVHLFYIIGFKSRITTLLHWSVCFLGRGRAERTITEQQVFAREAIEHLGDEPHLPTPPAYPRLSPRAQRKPSAHRVGSARG